MGRALLGLHGAIEVLAMRVNRKWGWALGLVPPGMADEVLKDGTLLCLVIGRRAGPPTLEASG
jgi:hypothetical protein